jgi:hypothetical protein
MSRFRQSTTATHVRLPQGRSLARGAIDKEKSAESGDRTLAHGTIGSFPVLTITGTDLSDAAVRSSRVKLLLVATTTFVATATVGAAGGRYVSDNVFRVPLPSGWFGSVAFGGGPPGPPPAWINVGNFFFPSNYASTHEGAPAVPRRKVLIVLGDFGVSASSRHWQRVDHLRLPHRHLARRSVAWHVRFHGRALWLNVRFGSIANARDHALANAVLATVTPVR